MKNYQKNRRRKYSFRLLNNQLLLFSTALLLEIGFMGCEDFEEETIVVGESDSPLYVLSTGLWDPGEVEVCWTSGGYAAEKAVVKEAVTHSWQAYTNVTFTGWGNCPLSGDGIQITPGSQMVTYSLGRPSSGICSMQLDFTATPENTWTRCVENSLDRDECIGVVAVHEFGHALGFAHEHNRPDTPASCTDPPQGTNGDTLVGEWDGNSIMNYCSSAKSLSQGDVYGSIKMYGMDPALAMTAVSSVLPG